MKSNKNIQKIPFIITFVQAIVVFKRLAKKYRDRFGYRKGQKLSKKKGNSLQKAIQASQNTVVNASFGKGLFLYISLLYYITLLFIFEFNISHIIDISI